MKQFIFALALAGALGLPVLHAQEQLGGGVPQDEGSKSPGWIFTPMFGVSEAYDDNVSLFGNQTTSPTADYVSTVFPGANLGYTGRHTHLAMGYRGSFLNYRTYSALNRWDQNAHVDLKREETARLGWFASANTAMLPSTDLVDLGGIPYRRVGTETYEARGGVSYVLGRRDSLSSSLRYQDITFQNSETPLNSDFLRGGHIFESLTAYRRALSERLSAGVDYSFRRGSVRGFSEQFDISTVEAAGDYQLSPAWSMSAGAGFVHVQANALEAARTGPAGRVTLARNQEGHTFHVGYVRSYIPAFGLGGTIQNQELGVGFRTPLFHTRHLYTDNSLVFRDDTPLGGSSIGQLPLRSLRTYSVLGWNPQRWVRFEAFYARVQQSTLRPGGDVDRNRVGFQIVTSKPMRMQ